MFDHLLFQYVIESVDRVHHIDDYSTETLSSKVLQIKVLSEKAEVLILTENSVSTNCLPLLDRRYPLFKETFNLVITDQKIGTSD